MCEHLSNLSAAHSLPLQTCPIMDDQQREIVGTCYSNHGQDKAIEKGHELVQGEIT